MPATRWDPAQYARFSDHRSRPFFELVGRVGAEDPRRVVDLGCGSGELTVTLGARWPGRRGRFDATGTDVLVSNAMLQWVPGHVPLLGRWADVWQTVNEQVLTGDDPVLAALDPEAAARFESQYAARLREAYPAAPYGTVFRFARIFVVARVRGRSRRTRRGSMAAAWMRAI